MHATFAGSGRLVRGVRCGSIEIPFRHRVALEGNENVGLILPCGVPVAENVPLRADRAVAPLLFWRQGPGRVERHRRSSRLQRARP
jgi:hypothetical protein